MSLAHADRVVWRGCSQALAQLALGIPLLPPDRRMHVLRRAVEVVHPRAASFPNFVRSQRSVCELAHGGGSRVRPHTTP